MKRFFNFKNLSLALVLLAAVLCVVYFITLTPPSEKLASNLRVAEMLNQGGCVSCHTSDAERPFYADFPVIGKVVIADIEEGYRAFDIEPLCKALAEGAMPNPVDVAKVEKVIADGTMPAAKYYLMHWGSQSTSAKAEIITDWATAYRTEFYNDGLVGSRAGEPVRPIAEAENIDQRKVELGYKLYHDTRLSVDNTVSCATCHVLSAGGVDNHQYSHGVEERLGGVNAPTVYNAVYNFVQFWDGRAKTLAEQAAGPPLNPVEMASTSFDEIIAKLNEDKEFVAEFTAVYPDGFTEANITNAIEEIERTHVTPNSQFDKWLRGDDAALTAQALRGYALFTQTQLERDRHRFKVPGLRNVELTWPYYHDGTRETLEEAVADMARYQSDVDITDEESAAIVSFLRTLTGEYKGVKLTNPNEYGVTLDAEHDHHDHK